jgi:hypothetical protein
MITRNYLLVAVLATTSVILSPTPGAATTYYVTKTGNDTNPCTQSQPCMTISRGLSIATSPGDIVEVGAGIYNETAALVHSGSSAGGKIILRGYNSTSCATTASSDPYTPNEAHPNPSVRVDAVSIQADYVRVECLDVSGSISLSNHSNVDIWDNYIHPINGSGDTGIVGSGSNWSVLRNYIYWPHYGFVVTCSSNCMFQDNEVNKLQSGNGQGDMDYSRVFGAGITFRHNYYHGADIGDCYGGYSQCHVDCIQTFGGGAHNVTWDSNVCFNSNQGTMLEDSTSSTYGTYSSLYDWTITNNLIGYGTSSPFGITNVHPICVDVMHGGSFKIQHNTCVGGFIELYNGSQVTSIENNIVSHSEYTYCYTPIRILDTSQVLTERNNILDNDGSCTISSYPNDLQNVDPGFIKEASTGPASDFHLQSSSRAINSGSTGLGVTKDLDGNTRDSMPDIGAYEFGTVTSSSPAPPTALKVTVF